MSVDSKLYFSEHLKTIFRKTNKTIGLLRKLQIHLPRAPLITIYKSFIRPHLDYGDMIYDQTFNISFQQKMETIQYNAALAISAAIRGFSRERLYQLGLETWYRNVGIENFAVSTKYQNHSLRSTFIQLFLISLVLQNKAI